MLRNCKACPKASYTLILSLRDKDVNVNTISPKALDFTTTKSSIGISFWASIAL